MTSSLFSIDALLGVVSCPLIQKLCSLVLQRRCGRNLVLLLEPGLCSPWLSKGQPVGCESHASFTRIFPCSWKEAVLSDLVLKSTRFLLPGNWLLVLFSGKHILPFISAQNFHRDFITIMEIPAGCIAFTQIFVIDSVAECSARLLCAANILGEYGNS